MHGISDRRKFLNVRALGSVRLEALPEPELSGGLRDADLPILNADDCLQAS